MLSAGVARSGVPCLKLFEVFGLLLGETLATVDVQQVACQTWLVTDLHSLPSRSIVEVLNVVLVHAGVVRTKVFPNVMLKDHSSHGVSSHTLFQKDLRNHGAEVHDDGVILRLGHILSQLSLRLDKLNTEEVTSL